MGEILDKVRSKVIRAGQHLSDFERALSAFLETGPYEIRVKEDAQRGKRIHYAARVDCVPDSLSTIAADVIQNLRSPLDHIAYQLVLAARGGSPPDWNVYYPITREASSYEARRAGLMKGVSQQVAEAIDATEPYRGGKGELLWQLNELNNPDKHHLLVGAATLSVGFDLRDDVIRLMGDESNFSRPEYAREFPALVPSFFLVEHSPTPLKAGVEVLIEPLDEKAAEKRRFKFGISLNAPAILKPEPATKTLQDYDKPCAGRCRTTWLVTPLKAF